MALVSPGIQISINDQSQYVANAVGSIPFVLLATEENKTYNGSLAAGTTKANAGKLQSFTSQRDLVTAMGTPMFQTTVAGTPEHAGQRNEYGLMAAYSALGLGNQLYAIRADIDLAQLTGTSVRPRSAPASMAQWLDLANTEWGIYEKDTTEFTHVTDTSATAGPLLVITDSTQVEPASTEYPTLSLAPVYLSKPKSSVGSLGSYAIVAVKAGSNGSAEYLRLWKKTNSRALSTGRGGPGSGAWVEVGSRAWQLSIPVVVSSTFPSYTVGGSFVITTPFSGSTTITTSTSPASLTNLIADINAQAPAGVKAGAIGNGIAFYVTSAAGTTNPSVQEAKITIGSRTNIVFDTSASPTCTDGDYYAPSLFYGTYADRPNGGWGFSSAEYNRPNGSVWWKIGSTGNGLNLSLKKYNSSTQNWDNAAVPVYKSSIEALYYLDPTAGGLNIIHGTDILTYVPVDGSYNGLRLLEQLSDITPGDHRSVATAVKFVPGSFTNTDTFTIRASVPGQLEIGGPTTITCSSSWTADDFVAAVLSAGIPYVSASVTADGRIQVVHQTGGSINFFEVAGSPLEHAGFLTDADGSPISGGTGYTRNESNSAFYYVNRWNHREIQHELTIDSMAPYGNPTDGTYWYYSNPTEVDIMINTSSGWKGYQNGGTDTRGYDLSYTDSYGVIVSASQPSAQYNGNSLVSGDLWLDSSDLVNYPALYRYDDNTVAWTKIDNTDHVSTNGIIFADARWGTGGSVDPISDSIPAIADLVTSDYLDLDAPDYRLYPTGILLFNTRRSGYNVKKFISNYFNADSYPPDSANTIGLPTSTPSVTDAWVSVSGKNEDGSLKAGPMAQRAIVVDALKAAVDSNFEIREDRYSINLLCAPGYPELIDNLVTLNADRGDTGFIIGDTPMTLAPTATAISAWNNNTDGMGLATASAYLGVYYPAGLTNDLSGNIVAVPASHMALRTFLYSDNVSYPWFAPAGTHRGLVSNVSDIGYVDEDTGSWKHNAINQGLRDALYTQSINPITQLPGVGIVVWGQETKSGTTTSRNRVNVVRLENYLRTVFKTVANGYLFEPNDQATRKSIAGQIESALNDVLGKRGIYDFLVVCDSTNNTSSAIANSQLFVDVAIEPARDVEFIYIPIALYNPGTVKSLGTTSS